MPPPQAPYEPTPVSFDLPVYFPQLPIPADNPPTEEGIALGRKLFYDTRLSGDNSQSCASCHIQAFGFSDTVTFSIGIDGLPGKRNAMPIINVGWMDRLFWDGRATRPAHQATFPVADPLEMHADWDDVVSKLQADADYEEMFRKAFRTAGITKDRVVKAIEQFELTMLSYHSKTDSVTMPGSGVFYTDLEQEGFDLFYSERADCFHCHSGILFTDNLFHNNGLDSVHDADKGLYNVTHDDADIGKFKTPTLRNIEFTAPYMHDGRFKTLDEVLDFYASGVQVSPTLDPLMSHQGGIQLDAHEKEALKAFLLTLSDRHFLENPDFAKPD